MVAQTTKFYTLKGSILWYVYYILIKVLLKKILQKKGSNNFDYLKIKHIKTTIKSPTKRCISKVYSRDLIFLIYKEVYILSM